MVPGRFLKSAFKTSGKGFRAPTGGGVLPGALIIPQNLFENSRDLFEKTWKCAKKFSKLRFLNRLPNSTLLRYGLEITFI